ncbi:Hypothetical protein PENO1_087350 [Penicillium occitanis (nom. inval.)]|nr:Hypothetical protein PENO1_087350 [Penicillium occitanis (nom. inval.)]PCG92969.1 hypothetical protein PENOC_089990 [Penicillium occitanis (nom. inval.)]
MESASDEYCIGVLYDDKTPENANAKKDLMWFKCKSITTIGSILKAYESGVALPQKIVLQCDGSILQPADTVSKLSTNRDKVILIEAVAQTTSNPSNSTSQRDPLQPRSTNDVVIKSEASMDHQIPKKHAPPSDGSIIHALPYQLKPPPGVDKHRLVNVMNLICKYEGTDKNALNEHILTYGELMLLFTMVDFVHEKLAQLRDTRGPNFTSFTETDRQIILNQWLLLTPELCQWYQKRAVLFIDSASIENGSAAQEMIRFKNENAGFYAFYLSTKDKYLEHVKTYGSDKAFMMVHSDWRATSHRKIAYWVRNGRTLRYMPVAASDNLSQTQSIQAAAPSEQKMTDSSQSKRSDLELSKPNEPEAEPSKQFSLQTLFTDCTPELLEAGVEHGVNLLERLKEPLRRVVPDLDAAEWLKNIENLQKQAQQPKTIVGVVGNTGAGKSSVINAMLDEERLVPTNCMRACTAVVTEISYNYEEIPYRAEIEFVTEKDWEKELQVLFSDLLDSNGNVSREASNQDSEAGVAYAKIKAVYPKYTHEMLSRTTAEKLLKHPAVQKVLGGKKNIADSNPAAFYKHLQSYVDSKEKSTGVENKQAKPSMEMEYWPLIKVVRIYVKSAALSTGAVIVDLPGVHDSNAARARVAEGYMKQCTGLWIVAPITRAVDDKAAKSLLGETFKRQLKMDGGFDSVTFICSKTDDISILEAQESLGLEQEMGGLWAKSDEYNSEKRKHKKRLDELKETKEEYTAVVDEIDEQIEIWEALKDDIDDGKTVYAPRDSSSSKKRKRGRQSKASGAPRKRQRSSDSDLDSNYASNDDNDGADSEEDESEPKGEPLTLEDIEEKLAELKTTKKEGRRHRQEIEAEMKVVRKQISELNEEDAKVQAEMSHIAISGRNEYSRGAIQQDFASGIRELDHELAEETDASNFNPDVDVRDYDKVAKSLPVFCVSSRAYQKLSGRFQKEANVPGFRTVEETEVPQLQAHCKKLTEASREANSRRFLNALDQLLNSLRLVTSSDGLQVTDKQKATRAAIVESTYNQLDKEIVQHIKNICDQIAEEIESDIIEACNKATPTASEAALDMVSRWGAPVNRFNRAEGGFYWSTYKALCRRDGVYANAQGPHNWNAELIEPIMKAVAPGWEKIFSRRVHTIFNNAGSEIANLLKKFHDTVYKEITQATGPLGSLHMLSQQLRIYQQSIKELFNQQVMDMSMQSRDINRMFEPVIVEVMVPVYAICVEERGSGSFMRMKAAMSSHVSSNRTSMFEKSVDEVQAALDRMCETIEDALLAKTDTTLMSLKRDYRSAVVGSQSSAGGTLPREKRAALQEILQHINDCETSYKQLTQSETQEDVSMEPAGDSQEQEPSPEPNDDPALVKEEEKTSKQAEENTTEVLPSPAAATFVKEEQSDVVPSENNDISIKPDPEDDDMAASQLEADLFNWDA